MAERRERPFWIWSPRLTLLPAGLLSFYDFNKAGSPTPSEPREKRTLTILASARGQLNTWAEWSLQAQQGLACTR